MRAPGSQAPNGSRDVPDWTLAMLAHMSSSDKQSRKDKAAEHTRMRFLRRPQPELLSAG
eukprot:CAMPEP_0204232312 /NCGR_PEP_ID=MMETSP0361-20130328/89340_1 /ASSEMBLY_ACC=CAM_ASM_000343 /TAXON_ID=268821 /ORGANISM="Scrippsiella Hangoei, Strain SHTV-5" /LENGTH=58 /DNA_ID=CAMNT_0051202171 /DNA_START=49 /DNA_END=225 /DNA_ORIENTATION=-